MTPAPLNPDFRPGFAEALETAYNEHCEDHSCASQELLAKAHGIISFRISSSGEFPTIAEIEAGQTCQFPPFRK